MFTQQRAGGGVGGVRLTQDLPLCLLFFLRCDLSQGQWVRCNTQIQKTCQYPVFGLEEGTWYQFRVCAVNKAGTGRPSMGSQPVFTQDPLEHTRTMGNTFDTDMKREMWKCQSHSSNISSICMVYTLINTSTSIFICVSVILSPV